MSEEVKKPIQLGYKQPLIHAHLSILAELYGSKDITQLNGGRVSSVQTVTGEQGTFVSKLSPQHANPTYEVIFLSTGSQNGARVPQLYTAQAIPNWKSRLAKGYNGSLSSVDDSATCIEMQYIDGLTAKELTGQGMQLEMTSAYASTLRDIHNITLEETNREQAMESYPLQGLFAFYEWLKDGTPLDEIFSNFEDMDQVLADLIISIDEQGESKLITFDGNPNNASYIMVNDNIEAFIFDPGFCPTYGGDPLLDLGFFYRRSASNTDLLEAFENGYGENIDWSNPTIQLGVIIRSLLTLKVLNEHDQVNYLRRIDRERQTITTALAYLSD